MNKLLKAIVLFSIALSILASCNQTAITAEEFEMVWSGDKHEIMPLLNINNTADSIFLRSKARSVSRKSILNDLTVQHLKSRMLATLTDPLNPGLGIAAQQVGVGLRMVYVQRLDKPLQPFEIYYNPKIEVYGDSINSGMEGCLSIPSFRGHVERSQNIVVSYLDSTGQKQQEAISGFTAVIFQHEIDHLQGIFYFDHIFGGFESLIQVNDE